MSGQKSIDQRWNALPADKYNRVIALTVVAISISYFFSGLWLRPVVNSDALNGMLSLLNHLNGAPWNTSFSIDPKNGQVLSHSLTWWAPGQYELPHMVMSLFPVDIGTAIVLLLFCAMFAGCYFYNKLFQFSELGQRTVLLALLFLILQRFINISFILYSSPDLFLFFYTPFYIFAYFMLTSGKAFNQWYQLFILTVLNLFGLLLKNSFLLFELAFNIFLVLEYFFKAGLKISLSRFFLLLLPFFLANMFFYFFYLRLGENPGQGTGWQLTVPTVLNGLFMPLIQVTFASLSISGICGNLYEKITLPSAVTIVLMACTLLATGFFLYKKRIPIAGKLKRDRLFRATLVISACYVCFWLYFTLHQSAVSNEDRLFLPVTIFLFPYLLDYAIGSVSRFRYLYFLMIAVSSVYGISSFAYRIGKYAINGSVYSASHRLHGFKLLAADQASQTDLQKIADFVARHFKDYYIVVQKPEMAFAMDLTNRCIVVPGIPISTAGASRPGVLILTGKSERISGQEPVFSAGDFILYKSVGGPKGMPGQK